MTSPDEFVLVVDDDDDIRDSIGSLLELEGHQVVCAANGRDALEAIRDRGRPCLILLDLMMPVMDGAEFRTRQLADPTMADIPVVLITAAGPHVAKAVPSNRVLPKPLWIEGVLEVVAEFC